MNKYIKASKELLNFIDNSPSCYHVIDNLKKMLKDFTKLNENDNCVLEAGKGYYITRNSSSLIAFYIPKAGELSKIKGFNICAAHSDSPSFKIKPNALIETEKHYYTLNVEKYGGMLMAPWMDRPLSIAGRILFDSKDGIFQKLINIDRDLLIIPNVAIHMNRDANNGYKYNPQKDMLPLFSLSDHPDITNDVPTTPKSNRISQTKRDLFMDMVAKEAGIESSSILGSDLFLYNRVKGTLLGLNNEMIAARALDDLQCAYSITQGFIKGVHKAFSHIPVCCIFDNEEVGSLTKQGADSTFLYDTLKRISLSIHTDKELSNLLTDSFMISADNAHAVHPNHPEYADPTNRPYLNGGIVIKYNANQKYTTDACSEARLKALCKKASIPYQEYTNRSDIAGGSTLGNLSNRHISINTVDIGLPQLAMHSSYETGGSMDTLYMINLIKEYVAS
ncbi:MAG: M18 family aminopeptidase [Lachnospiraceae bacterium]|nr:M18 family aminopeptidase [Lachnospiraceae bacterium]